MIPNPFIELYTDPLHVLGSLAYALLLLGVTIQLAARGWTTLVWLSEAWEWRQTDQRYGGEWTWYLPPPDVYNRITILVLLAAIEAFLIGALIYVVTHI